MQETKVDFVPEKETKTNGKFHTKCFHCKDKENLTYIINMEKIKL